MPVEQPDRCAVSHKIATMNTVCITMVENCSAAMHLVKCQTCVYHYTQLQFITAFDTIF